MKNQKMNPYRLKFTAAVLFLFSLAFAPAVFAQGIKNFTTDPAKFQEEMFLMETDKKRKGRRSWKPLNLYGLQVNLMPISSNQFIKRVMQCFANA